MRAALGMPDPDDGITGQSGYQGASQSRRDLPDGVRMGATERALKMLDEHPLVSRGAQILNDWMSPREFTLKSTHPAIQAVLDEHMGDPRNDWPTRPELRNWPVCWEERPSPKPLAGTRGK